MPQNSRKLFHLGPFARICSSKFSQTLPFRSFCENLPLKSMPNQCQNRLFKHTHSYHHICLTTKNQESTVSMLPIARKGLCLDAVSFCNKNANKRNEDNKDFFTDINFVTKQKSRSHKGHDFVYSLKASIIPPCIF